MNLKERRYKIWKDCEGLNLCAVTKNRSIREVVELLADLPGLKMIGENRWPDCEEKFKHFTDLEKHFIGPLQSNKVRKVVALADVIQSVDSLKLLERIDVVAGELGKVMKFGIQVNVSKDGAKSGVQAEELNNFIEQYLGGDFENIELVGLMTIGEVGRTDYFAELKLLFDQVNEEYFKDSPLETLSMGMSSDYLKAIDTGATMLRIGSLLF